MPAKEYWFWEIADRIRPDKRSRSRWRMTTKEAALETDPTAALIPGTLEVRMCPDPGEVQMNTRPEGQRLNIEPEREMKVYVKRLWSAGRRLGLAEQKPGVPGRFEVGITPTGTRVAHLFGGRRDSANPNLIAPLHDVQIVKCSGQCMRLRGRECESPKEVLFQEWVLDFHPDGYGKFDE